MLILGLLFGGVPAYAVYELSATDAAGASAIFTFGTLGLVGTVFGVFSALMVVSGFYLLGNSLEVTITPLAIETVRRVYGVPMRRRHAPRELVAGLHSKITGQTGQGAKAKVRYTINADLRDGKSVTVGDGIRGVTEMKRILAQLREYLDLPEQERQRVQ